MPLASGFLIFLNGCLEDPRIVPPSVKIPEKSSGFISTYFSYIKPLYPSRIPIICVSWSALYNVFATPRIVAFKAWQSPPLVKKATRLISASLSKVRVLDTFFSLPYFAGLGNSGMNFVVSVSVRILFYFRNSTENFCVSWAFSLIECVTVWALKLPVPHTDVLKTHESQTFSAESLESKKTQRLHNNSFYLFCSNSCLTLEHSLDDSFSFT